MVGVVLDSPTVALVTVLVLLVIMEPPMDAVVVIELDLVVGVVEPPVDRLPVVVVLLLLDALVVALLDAILAVVVVVELVLVTDPLNVDGAPAAVVAAVPPFVVTTVTLSWPLLAVLSCSLFSSALTVVTRRSSRVSHLLRSASTD